MKPHPFLSASGVRPAWGWTLCKLALVMAGLAVLSVVALAPILGAAWWSTTQASQMWDDIPPMPAGLAPLAERSTVVDPRGQVLATLYEDTNRIEVSLEEVAPEVIDAVIATEDQEFYTHDGVNWRSVGRALLANIQAGGIAEGGSTISQQLVKMALVGSDLTVDRKLTELRYAIELEATLSKDEILERYLNEAYFGENVYGIGTAAERYFGLDAAELDAGQAATLAGVLRAPHTQNPVANIDAAQTRRDVVLTQMVSTGALSPAAAQSYQERDIELDLTDPPKTRYPFFVEAVLAELLAEPALGDTRDERADTVFNGGLTVEATIDTELQDTAQQQLAAQLADSDGVAADRVRGAAITVEAGTGAITSMAVGPHKFGSCGDDADSDCDRSSVNPAIPGLGGSGRPAGSAFKPAVAAAGLEQAHISTVTRDGSSGRQIVGCNGWQPTNYGGSQAGQLDLYDAMRTSNNLFFADLIGQVGPEAVADTGRRLGVVADIGDDCAIALGGLDLFPSDLAAMMATFAADGQHCPTHTVAAVRDRHGDRIDTVDRQADCEQTVDAGVAARVTDTLTEVVADGTGTDAAVSGHPTAGKTGTSSDHHDAWFAGTTAPTGDAGEGAVAAAVWFGYDTPRELRDVLGVSGPVTGGSAPAQLFAQLVGAATDGRDAGRFTRPPDELITLDRLVGQQLDDVEAALSGLTVNVATAEDWRDEGTVLSQSPGAGTRARYRSTVSLVVSDGAGDLPQVPAVTGDAGRSARQSLKQAGYEVRITREPVLDGTQHGRVLRQFPAAGAFRQPGAQVELIVGDDVRPRLPDATGQLAADAAQQLRSAGFLPQQRTVETLDPSQVGRVLTQTPAGGHQVDTGKLVVLHVAVDGRAELADVVATARADAVGQLEAAGFEVAIVEVADDVELDELDVDRATLASWLQTTGSLPAVIAQSPAAGLVDPDVTVELTVIDRDHPALEMDVDDAPADGGTNDLDGGLDSRPNGDGPDTGR